MPPFILSIHIYIHFYTIHSKIHIFVLLEDCDVSIASGSKICACLRETACGDGLRGGDPQLHCYLHETN